ncbi:MAG: flagellar export chaperone FliS [Cellvibrionaceae bacterium]
MNMYNSAAAYSNVHIESRVTDASPHRLIQMLFEGALERIAQAKGAMRQNQIERKGSLINKAVSIVGGLQGALEDNGDTSLSVDLDALYDYMIRRLIEANSKNDEKLLDEVAGLIHEIKSAWDTIAPEVV